MKTKVDTVFYPAGYRSIYQFSYHKFVTKPPKGREKRKREVSLFDFWVTREYKSVSDKTRQEPYRDL